MSNSEDQDYLTKNCLNILEPLTNALLVAQPENVTFFMIEWLKHFYNLKTQKGIEEREELESLKTEIEAYKIPEKRKLKKLLKKGEKFKPKKKIKFTNSLEKKSILKKSNNDSLLVDSYMSSSYSNDENHSEESEGQKEFQKEIELKKKKKKKKGQRTSVSAEVFGLFNKKEDFVAKIIPKNHEQKNAIRKKVLQSFMFNSLEDKDLETVIDAFFEVKLSPGEFAIKQGEEGDAIYLVEKGELECNKVFKEGDPPTFLKNYEPGESFGELALLYNCPRAANIIAKTDCILWGLDRQTFNYIVKDSAIKKREKYENTLKNVSIFSTLDNYELSQICDAIRVETFEKGKTVIRQNEKGDKFYILDEGECYASIIFSHNEEPIKVKEYQKGDYFGERALIKNEPRAATIVTKSNCKFLVLDRFAFKRLLGNINTILQRNIVLYEQYNEKIKNKK